MVLKQFSKLVEVELVDRPLVPVIRNPSYPRTSVHCIRPDFEPSDHSSKLELGIFSKYPMHWLSSCICGAFLHSHASSQRWKFSRKLTPTLVSMSCVSRLGLAVGLWEWVVRFNYRRTFNPPSTFLGLDSHCPSRRHSLVLVVAVIMPHLGHSIMDCVSMSSHELVIQRKLGLSYAFRIS